MLSGHPSSSFYLVKRKYQSPAMYMRAQFFVCLFPCCELSARVALRKRSAQVFRATCSACANALRKLRYAQVCCARSGQASMSKFREQAELPRKAGEQTTRQLPNAVSSTIKSHGAPARALRHARSAQRVRQDSDEFARGHSESTLTRTIPARKPQKS